MSSATNTSLFSRLSKAVPGVVSYELTRSMTPGRWAMFLLMVCIPTALLIAVSQLTPNEAKYTVNVSQLPDGKTTIRDETNLAFCMLVYLLIPQVMTMLGMLVLASPIVHSELEGQTWIYALVRHAGRRSLLLGKYLVAVLWTSTAGILAVSLATPFLPLQNPAQLWLTASLMCLLASLAYGALFALIGVVMQKRVMVISFVYALVAEGVLAWIPAVINQFTIAYRLRSILFRWLDLSVDEYFPNMGLARNAMVAQDPSGWVQVAWVLLISGILLGLALWLVETIQYSFQSEL
jgi:ABC-type transport system involved in multi-copper enzyme maturation permease subunit